MGMNESVRCEVELPGLGMREDIAFSTKNLYCYGGTMVITRQGRLAMYGKYPDRASLRDEDYHGDLHLLGGGPGENIEYVARFTHGQLEWIRPATDLPEDYLLKLRLRG